MKKSAEEMPTNEGHMAPGRAKVRPDPAGREPGTISARWGDQPKLDRDGYPTPQGTGVEEEANEGRAGVLENLFDEMGHAAAADKALIGQHFATPTGEHRTPHSPLLQKSAFARHEPTLRERVRGILGKP